MSAGKLRAALAGVIPLLAFCTPTHANFECTGQVASFATYSDGGVIIDIGHGTWWLCNLKMNVTYGGVENDASVCKTWIAQLVAAQKTNTSVGLFLASASVTGWNPPECSSVASWSYPGVILVRSLAD